MGLAVLKEKSKQLLRKLLLVVLILTYYLSVCLDLIDLYGESRLAREKFPPTDIIHM